MARILHAGFHKTGSTFLQRNVFPLLEHVDYVGSFRLNGRNVLTGNENILFSSEASCGYPYPYTECFSTDRIAKNIKILGVEKIILIKLEFFSWVLSLYFQTLNERYDWNLQTFVQINHDKLLSWRHADVLICDWCEKANVQVLIIDYNKFLDNPAETIAELGNYIGGSCGQIPFSWENKSKSGVYTIASYRVLNYCCRSKIVYGLFRLFRLTPRRIIAGRLGGIIESVPQKKLSRRDVEGFFRT